MSGNNEGYEECKAQIDLFYKFINEVRAHRITGVRTSIDIAMYLIAALKGNDNLDDNYKWNCLNDALWHDVLPQFDRLDGETINAVLEDAKSCLTHEAFNPFREELQQASDRLQKAGGFLTGKN